MKVWYVEFDDGSWCYVKATTETSARNKAREDHGKTHGNVAYAEAVCKARRRR